MGYIDNDPCLQAAQPTEPIFVLLGRDPDAAAIVRAWAELAACRQPPEQIAEAVAHADVMETYARTHYPHKFNETTP
jgi:hypothetical protein